MPEVEVRMWFYRLAQTLTRNVPSQGGVEESCWPVLRHALVQWEGYCGTFGGFGAPLSQLPDDAGSRINNFINLPHGPGFSHGK